MEAVHKAQLAILSVLNDEESRAAMIAKAMSEVRERERGGGRGRAHDRGPEQECDAVLGQEQAQSPDTTPPKITLLTGRGMDLTPDRVRKKKIIKRRYSRGCTTT
jgi:hypothetical protein